MNCPKCHAEISGDPKYCPNCGARLKEKTKNILVPILCAVIAVLIIILAVTFGFIIKKDKSKPVENTTETENIIAETTTDIKTEEIEDTENKNNIFAGNIYKIKNTPSGKGAKIMKKPADGAEVITILSEGETVYCLKNYDAEDKGYALIYKDEACYIKADYLEIQISQDNGNTQVPSAGKPAPSNPVSGNGGKNLYAGMTARIKNNTPANAGINLREKPTNKSGLIATLEEGSYLDIIESYSPDNNGYIYVGTVIYGTGTYEYGWVMADYLSYCGYRDTAYSHYYKTGCRVSYDTPAHAGINLRQYPSSDSYLIDTIPEGEELIIAQPYNEANNGYIKVFAKSYYGDDFSLEGWVMNRYIEYY